MRQGKGGYLANQNQSLWAYSVESNLLSMPMSRTIASIQLKSSSLTPYCTSCEIQFPKNGRVSEVRPQITFALSLTKTFRFWSESGTPPKSPELNPVENIWQYLRANYVSDRVFENYDAIVEAACEAWNKLISQPQTITSIGMRDWAHVAQCFLGLV